MLNHNSLLLLDISMSMHTSLDDIDRINKIYIYLDWAPKRKNNKKKHTQENEMKGRKKSWKKIKAFLLLCFLWCIFFFCIYSIQIYKYIFFRCVLFVSYLYNKIILKTIRINKVLQCRSFGHYTVFSSSSF